MRSGFLHPTDVLEQAIVTRVTQTRVTLPLKHGSFSNLLFIE